MKKTPFKQARFLTSALKEEECPNLCDSRGQPLPEMAIVGRSNVGKSSLLNHLMQTKSLAKVSSTPGKTQRLNYFLIDDTLLLVDLPGYGYAKVNHTTKQEWATHLEDYLNTRPSLRLLLFLLDIRRIPNEDDLAFLEWAKYQKLPTILVLTKSDKLNEKEKNKQTDAIFKKLGDDKSLSGLPIVHYSIKEGKCKHKLITLINQIIWD